MYKILAIFCAALLLPVANCGAEGLGTLIELGRSQSEMQKQYAEETKAFERVKKAIETGAIVKGMHKDSIAGKYGEPVVIVDDLDGKRKDWIYKPADSSFFKGVRATLFFVSDGTLDEARVEER